MAASVMTATWPWRWSSWNGEAAQTQALESGADPGNRTTPMDPLQAKQQMTLAEFRSLRDFIYAKSGIFFS